MNKMIDVDINNQLVSRVAEVLIFLKNNRNSNVRNLSKELNIDYNYMSKIIVRCEEKNLLNTKIVSREKIINLTKKGEKVSDNLEEIKKEIGGK
jgi:DNA-binding MarR family transcriptional regulator